MTVGVVSGRGHVYDKNGDNTWVQFVNFKENEKENLRVKNSLRWNEKFIGGGFKIETKKVLKTTKETK